MPSEAAEGPSRGASGRPLDGRTPLLPRWLGLIGIGGLATAGASALLSPRVGGPFVVLWGVDSYGWSFLFGSTAALLTLTFFSVQMNRLLRNRRGWLAGLLEPLAMLLLLAILVVGIPLGLLAGLLSFKNSYREIGRVDGRAVVVQQFAGWDTDDLLDAGYRDGPFVSFAAVGDYNLDRPSSTISAWRFTMTTTSTSLLIHYRAGAQPQQAGVLRLPRHTTGTTRTTQVGPRAGTQAPAS